MDVIDILGGLLGRKSGSGKGPDITDIFGRGKRSAPEHRGGGAASTQDINVQAKELEDMLGVARERDASPRRSPVRRPSQPQPSQPSSTTPPRTTTQTDNPVDSPFSRPKQSQPTQDEQALVLVRAMLNAAKADGELSSDEQQNILQHVGGDSDEARRFLRDELSKPLDVREFAWSGPLGLEQQVSAMSLMAIEVDSDSERSDLRQLAHGRGCPTTSANNFSIASAPVRLAESLSPSGRREAPHQTLRAEFGILCSRDRSARARGRRRCLRRDVAGHAAWPEDHARRR